MQFSSSLICRFDFLSNRIEMFLWWDLDWRIIVLINVNAQPYAIEAEFEWKEENVLRDK